MSAKRGAGGQPDFMMPPWPARPVAGPAVWLYDGKRLRAWDDRLQLVVQYVLPVPEQGFEAAFVEGADGWLYGYFEGDNATLRRWRVRGTTLERETLAAVPSEVQPLGGFRAPGDWGAPLLVAPNGVLYAHGGRAMRLRLGDNEILESIEDDTRGYWRLVPGDPAWSFDAAGAPEVAWTTWSDLVGQPGPGNYIITTRTGLLRRTFHPAILPSGRWVAADSIPPFPVAEHDGAAVAAPPREVELTGTPEGPFQPSEFAPLTARTWGDAWWERPPGGGAWQPVVNVGFGTAQIALRPVDFQAAEKVPNVEDATDDSASAAARRAQAIGILPTITQPAGEAATFWLKSTATYPPSFPSDYIQADVPYQQAVGILTDRSSIYYVGQQGGTGSLFYTLGVWRATLPGVGGIPTGWQQLFEYSDPGTWVAKGVAVSRKWLWLVEEHVSSAVRRLRVYPKAGGEPQSVLEEAEVTTLPLCLTTAFKARWR